MHNGLQAVLSKYSLNPLTCKEVEGASRDLGEAVGPDTAVIELSVILPNPVIPPALEAELLATQAHQERTKNVSVGEYLSSSTP